MLVKFKKWLERRWATRSVEFNTDLRYEDIEAIPFTEAVDRVMWCLDDPVMYSNEPVKDHQAWQRVYGAAVVGNHAMDLRKQGPKALRDWIEELIKQDAASDNR